MEEVKYRDIRWPRGLNLHVLEKVLCDDTLFDLIAECAEKPRKERRIILPSRACIRKCFSYYLATKYNWDFCELMQKIKGEAKTLKSLRLRRDKIRDLALQRKKEIEEEQ